MVTATVLLVLAGIVNISWAIRNYHIHQGTLRAADAIMLSAHSVKAEADLHLREAKKIALAAKADSEYVVCAACKRIVAQHITTDGMAVCVNCATKKVLTNG